MLWVLLVCLFGFVLSFSISTFLHFGPDFSLLIGSIVAEALLVTTFLVLIAGKYTKSEWSDISCFEKLLKSVRAVADELVPRKILHLLTVEANVFKVLFFAFVRKKYVPDGSLSMPYGKEWRLTGYALVVVAAVELIVVDIACSGYLGEGSPVRLVALGISAYMLVWIVGYVLASRIMPHYVNDDELVIRCGIAHSVKIRLDDIAGIELKKIELEKRRGLFTSDGYLRVNNGAQVNELTVVLSDESSVLIDGKDSGTGLSGVSFSADFPKSMQRAIEEKLR